MKRGTGTNFKDSIPIEMKGTQPLIISIRVIPVETWVNDKLWENWSYRINKEGVVA